MCPAADSGIFCHGSQCRAGEPVDECGKHSASSGNYCAFGVLGAGTGVLWSALDLLRSSLGGVTAVGISALIHVIPNLNGVQKCAYHIAAGKVPVWHPVLVALFAAWVLVLGIFAIRRKEA